jgi:hypothetical protein
MAKKKPETQPKQTYAEYMRLLDPILAEKVDYIKKIVFDSDPELAVQIKWNSPCFYYTGVMKPFDPKEYKRDLIVIHLNKGYPMLVFPTGEKVDDGSGFLDGNFSDGRRLLNLKTMEDIEEKATSLQKVIKAWVAMID